MTARYLSSVCLLLSCFAVNANGTDISPEQKLQDVTSQYQKICTSEQCENQIKKMKKFARWRDPKAQLLVGTAYLYGDGIEQDIEKALYWLNRAAYDNSHDTKYSLKAFQMMSKIYKEGIGVDIDTEKSEKYTNKLLEKQYGPTVYAKAIALLKSNKTDEGITLLKQASENKYKPATYILARMFQLGNYTEQNIETAALYYQKIATSNFKDSKTQLSALIDQISKSQIHDTTLVTNLSATLNMEVIDVTANKVDIQDNMSLTLQRLNKNRGKYTAATGSRIKGRSCGQTSNSCAGKGEADLNDDLNEGEIEEGNDEN
jgi:TPR repeat protein